MPRKQYDGLMLYALKVWLSDEVKVVFGLIKDPDQVSKMHLLKKLRSSRRLNGCNSLSQNKVSRVELDHRRIGQEQEMGDKVRNMIENWKRKEQTPGLWE